MNEIDWSKAPEGATHWEPDSACSAAGFMKNADGGWWFWGIGSRRWKTCDVNQRRADRFIPRPSSPAWNGECLPPVGTVCEVLYDTHQRIYVPIVVLAHDEAGAVYRFTDGDRKGEYKSEQQGQVGGLPNFRPIRTPEQIAAEEREKAVDALCYEIIMHYGYPKNAEAYRALALKLHDAGYRKAEG